MSSSDSSTIAAISTPPGGGAIAIVRLSGPDAISVASEVFRGRANLAQAESHRQLLGGIYDDERLMDQVVVSVHRSPGSYTGEDVVEINCHGGILVTRSILQLLLNHGARPANPGEFTERAFLNGKMDLTQAEAVMDLIQAQTDLSLRAATEQLEGRLGSVIGGMRGHLLDLLAHVEAYIDFPDEDIDPDTGEALLRKLDGVRSAIGSLLATADQGRILREGVRTVIYGSPNVGKSSLLNLLLGYDRAIVSHLPGTTRDTIEEIINLRGIPLRLVDTAGVRECSDEIEKAGIERTIKSVEAADLVLHVVDGSQPNGERSGAATLRNQLLIINKMDLGEHPDWKDVEGIRISCRDTASLDRLADVIFNQVTQGKLEPQSSMASINARHQRCLQVAREYCDAGREGLLAGLEPALVAIELRAALDAVGEVVGKADNEELLGVIFSRFCIGK